MKKYLINLFTAAALLSGCNESLEETYSDYAGDGKIRYVAKCTEFHAIPLWEKLDLEWINGTDATIDKIKIIWSYEELRDSILLPGTTSSYTLENLSDHTYRFDICAMDAVGNESLKETTYGRPYTRSHEVMLAFTRGITKSYFLKNNLIFFSDRWNPNIEELKLQYKDTKGDTQYYVFEETSYSNLITIPDVSMDPRDTVYVFRKGRLEDCPEIIEFDPLAISRRKDFSAGFVNAIQRRYGYSTKTPEQEAEFLQFIENATELEFDYNMETFEDILYCPNLEKLVFGKNRYLNENYITDADRSVLTGSSEKSIQVVNKANEILGLTIDSYGGDANSYPGPHYFDSYSLDFEVNYMGYPSLPDDLVLVKPDELRKYDNGFHISTSTADPYANLDNLLDGDPNTRWETTSYSVQREYTLQMELNEETEIRGIIVAQALYDPMMDTQTPNFMPSEIAIQTSRDGTIWENVTAMEACELGLGSGEITLLPILEGSRRVRYIKITSLRDGVDAGGFCMIKLGDIVLYK